MFEACVPSARLATPAYRARRQDDAMDIEAWLSELGLAHYAQAFRDNDIDARSLPHLTGDDLKELGVTAIGTPCSLGHADLEGRAFRA